MSGRVEIRPSSLRRQRAVARLPRLVLLFLVTFLALVGVHTALAGCAATRVVAAVEPDRSSVVATDVVSASWAAPGDRFHVVQPGESLWSIARDLLGPGMSVAGVAREVNRLSVLNRERIATGDPDLILAGDTSAAGLTRTTTSLSRQRVHPAAMMDGVRGGRRGAALRRRMAGLLALRGEWEEAELERLVRFVLAGVAAERGGGGKSEGRGG